MKVLNLLTSGSFGGIEIYCKDIAINANYENGFCFMFGEGGVYELMKEQNHTVYSLCQYPRLSYKKLSALIKIAKEYDIIVVHHGDPFLQFYYLLLKIVLSNKKFVRTIHSCFSNYVYNDYGKVKILLCNFLEKKLLEVSDLIITVSNAVKETFAEAFDMDDKKVITIYNGISEEKLIKGKYNTECENETIQFLYIGRLVKEKGVHLLLEAFSELDTNKKVSLKIVGDGIARKELEDYTKELNLIDKVSFEGFRSNIDDYLSQCDIFVYPTMYESFGISIVEAMAHGCICVSNAVGGIPEIIEDGKNGFLSAEPNAQKLLEAITRACNSIELRNADEIRTNARECAKKFSITNTCSQLEKQFKKILAE